MKKLLIITILLLIAKTINAQIDSIKFINVYWESFKIERNGKFYHFKENEKSFIIFRMNGTFVFVFSKENLKGPSDTKWKYDYKSQSLKVFPVVKDEHPPMVFKVVSATEEELVLISDFNDKNDKVYYRKIELE